MPKLTKRIVDAAPIKPAPYFVWCSETRGFGVRIFPSGKRAYYVDYRTDGGARRRMYLGAANELTTEEARGMASDRRGEARHGDDPLLEKRTNRKAMTIAQLCDRYLAAADKGAVLGKRSRPKKVSTLSTDRGRIERHIKPLLGKTKVIDLTAADVTRFIRDVTEGKTAVVEKTKPRGKAVVEGGAGAATRTTGLLSGIIAFAVAEGVRPDNPVHGVKRPTWTPRTRRLSQDEYRALGQALAAAQDEGESSQAVNGVWLLALTGCRKQEIARLRWTETDAAGSCFRLGDTKEGASLRAIGRPAFDVLARIERKAKEPYVLAAMRKKGHYAALEAAVERMTERAGLEGVTAHTLRHSFGSVAGDLGYSELTIAALLGHAKGSVTSRYVHHLDTVLIAAADKVAGTIWTYMTGEAAKVLPFPQRANAVKS